MKYLKLIIDGLPEVIHMTFAYFGKNFTEESKVKNLLQDFKSFELEYVGEDLFGPNNDIPVYKYSVSQDIISYRDNFIRQFGEEIVKQNRFPWAPHLSRNKEFEPPKKIVVLGIETDDGSYHNIT